MQQGVQKHGGGCFALFVRCAAGLAFCGIALLFGMVFVSAGPALMAHGTDGVFIWSWRPYQGEFGILPMLCASVLLAFSALCIAWPASLAVTCWALVLKRGLCSTVLSTALRLMTAIPTVVYGFAAVFLVTPLIRAGLGGSGFCWLGAALVLALLILPTMVLVMEAGLAPRLAELCPGGLAIGLDRMELLCFFVLPQAKNTLCAAALLGLGRAFGDTLIPLMLAGNAPQLPGHPGDSIRSLTAHMALVTANEVGGAAYNSLFVAGALLLAVTAVTSLALRRVQTMNSRIPTL